MSATLDLLSGVVQTVATSLSLPVKFPNRETPEHNGTWLEIVHILNGTAREGWNDLQNEQGVFRVGVNVPPDNGTTDADPIIAALAAAFPQGTVLRGGGVRVEIYKPPVAGALIEAGQKAMFPLTMFYRSFAQ